MVVCQSEFPLVGGRGWNEVKPRTSATGASLRSSPGHPDFKLTHYRGLGARALQSAKRHRTGSFRENCKMFRENGTYCWPRREPVRLPARADATRRRSPRGGESAKSSEKSGRFRFARSRNLWRSAAHRAERSHRLRGLVPPKPAQLSGKTAIAASRRATTCSLLRPAHRFRRRRASVRKPDVPRCANGAPTGSKKRKMGVRNIEKSSGKPGLAPLYEQFRRFAGAPGERADGHANNGKSPEKKPLLHRNGAPPQPTLR